MNQNQNMRLPLIGKAIIFKGVGGGGVPCLIRALKGSGLLWHLLKPKLQEFILKKSYALKFGMTVALNRNNVELGRKVGEIAATAVSRQKKIGDGGGYAAVSSQFHIVYLFKATAIPNFSAVTFFFS